MAILAVSIDLEENVFAVEGNNEAGHAALKRPTVSSAKLPAPNLRTHHCVPSPSFHGTYRPR